MAYEQIIAATIDGRWMPTPGDPRDLGRLVLEVPEDGVGIGTVDVHLGHDVERDAVALPDARFDVPRGLGLLVAEPVWKSTGGLGYRADAVTARTSRRWPGNSTPSSRSSCGDNIASMSWGARYLISTQSRLVAREREDFEAGRAQLRVQPHHLGVVRVRLASFARDVRDQDDLVA